MGGAWDRFTHPVGPKNPDDCKTARRALLIAAVIVLGSGTFVGALFGALGLK